MFGFKDASTSIKRVVLTCFAVFNCPITAPFHKIYLDELNFVKVDKSVFIGRFSFA